MPTDYEKQLAWELHLRGVDEDHAREAMQQVRGRIADGEDPRAILGSPETFAGTVTPTRQPGKSKIVTAGAVLAIAWVLLALTAQFAFNRTLPEPRRIFVIGPAIVTILVSLVVGYGWDRRAANRLASR